jgi:hypothetical protein
MKIYEVKTGYLQKFYFYEKMSPNSVRVFAQFEVSCSNKHSKRTKLIKAVDFTGPGQYKKYPVNRTLVFICSLCGWENPEKIRIELT